MTQSALRITVVGIALSPCSMPPRLLRFARNDNAAAKRGDMAAPGPRNLITDVPGLLVGQAEDREAITGTTVLIAEQPAVAAVDVRGGAPGTRETELLDPAALIERVDSIVLSGGSAFGLDAAA